MVASGLPVHPAASTDRREGDRKLVGEAGEMAEGSQERDQVLIAGSDLELDVFDQPLELHRVATGESNGAAAYSRPPPGCRGCSR